MPVAWAATVPPDNTFSEDRRSSEPVEERSSVGGASLAAVLAVPGSFLPRKIRGGTSGVGPLSVELDCLSPLLLGPHDADRY